jgi:hypothetical protein
MTLNDLLQYAQALPGVGEAGGIDLVKTSRVVPPAPKPSRSRPNRGRKKRTNRSPLATPPWELLEGTGYPIPRDIKCLSYTPVNWRRGPEWARWRKAVHEMWGYRCHLCGHPNAHTADHLVPLSLWSNQPYDARLSRPAHGIDGCPTCEVKCNSSRGNRQLAIDIGQYKPPIAL